MRIAWRPLGGERSEPVGASEASPCCASAASPYLPVREAAVSDFGLRDQYFRVGPDLGGCRYSRVVPVGSEPVCVLFLVSSIGLTEICVY